MNKEGFVNSIREAVIDTSINSVESNLVKPPGRAPREKSLELSEWFNGLDDRDQKMVMQVVKESVETSVFGFLCVLDGVRAIEDCINKGRLNLYFEKEGTKTFLNNPEEEYLHDLL